MSKSDPATGEQSWLSIMNKAVSSLTKTISCRPKEVSLGDSYIASLLDDNPVLKQYVDMGKENIGQLNIAGDLFREWSTLGDDGLHLPNCFSLDEAFMMELRSTPGMSSHAKWLKDQLDNKSRKYMASEYKQSLRIVLGKMLMHKVGKNAISNGLQDKFPLFRLQQNATSCEYYSAAITSGGLTEAQMCVSLENTCTLQPRRSCGLGVASPASARLSNQKTRWS